MYRGNIHGAVLAASTGEEQRPWPGRLGVVCMKHAIINGMTEN